VGIVTAEFTPMDFFVWGTIKDKVNMKTPTIVIEPEIHWRAILNLDEEELCKKVSEIFQLYKY
jgi:hypothetical protein